MNQTAALVAALALIACSPPDEGGRSIRSRVRSPRKPDLFCPAGATERGSRQLAWCETGSRGGSVANLPGATCAFTRFAPDRDDWSAHAAKAERELADWPGWRRFAAAGKHGPFEMSDALGRRLVGEYRDGAPAGVWTVRNERGPAVCEVSFADGALRSEVAYRDDGTRQHEGTYRDGRPDGTWTGWYADGTTKWVARFAAGQREGSVIRFPRPPLPPPPAAGADAAPPDQVVCPPGATRRAVGSVAWCEQPGAPVDPGAARLPLMLLPHWNRSPRLPLALHPADPLARVVPQAERVLGGELLAARKHGPWLARRPWLLSGEFVDGRPAGIWRHWHRGAPAVEWSFAGHGDRLRWYATIHRDGGRLAGWYVDGRREGVWVYHAASGAKTIEGSFAAGLREGTWSCWDEAGKLLEAREWEEDLPRGKRGEVSCTSRIVFENPEAAN